MAETKQPKTTRRERTYFNKRRQALETERSSWLAQWRDISDFLQPVRGRFLVTDRNRGDKRYNSIIDSTATRALRITSAGLMAGMTSPARPWFRMSTTDPQLAEHGPVKKWLADVTDIMRAIFARSNVYRALHAQYEELVAFGTSACILDDDFDKVVRGHVLTVGEYMLAQNHRQEIDTIYREFEMQVGPMVAKFGREKCSTTVQNMYDRNSFDSWVPIVHAIEPRINRDPKMRDSKNMPFGSFYFEKGSREKEFLSEGGYLEFPGMAPRWSLVGGDIYGRSPGMESLGDIQQLQRNQQMKGKAVDYMADPPIQAPSSMKNGDDADFLPGGISYYNDAAGPNGGVRTAFDVNLDLRALLEDIQDVRQRINQTFYVDMFLMVSQLETQRTATEIAARQEEKLLMLGPVLERLHNELLDPLIDRTFNRALRTGILPPPPTELQGADLKVEYVSMLAQAQRAVGLNSVDRLLGTVGSIAAFRPDIVDKLSVDDITDGYADMLGIDPDFIVGNEQVALIREQRAQQQAQQEQAAMAPSAAQAAKTLSETDPNAVNNVIQQFSGL